MRTTLSLSLPLFLAVLPATALAQNPPIEDLVKTSPNGLTADTVAERAVSTSYTARASEENLRAADARVAASWANFLPRASGLARYTRLSELTLPSLTGAGSLVGTTAPPGTVNPPTVAIGGFSFPVILNNWTFQGTLTLPLSDYIFRINQAYTASTASRDAARYDLATVRARTEVDARALFYNWLRARAGLAVNAQSLAERKAHVTDAQNIFTVGRASKADVLRAETGVALAELALEKQKNLVDYIEKSIHIAMHDASDAPLVPGESLETAMPPFQGNMQQLLQEAKATRTELKSFDANIQAATKLTAVQRAGMFPSVAAIANVTAANPNPRMIPAGDYFFTTWDASIQLTWSPNDALISSRQTAAQAAQMDAIMAQKEAVRDGITLEVTQAFQSIKEAQIGIETGQRVLTSAQEAYRVARELFLNGNGTSTTLTDAEGELNQARLQILNAQVEMRLARVRMDHALGRDAKVTP